LRKSTIELLVWAGVAYATILVLARGIFPSESTPTISLTVVPLAIIALIIVLDLRMRSTSPTERHVSPRHVKAPMPRVRLLSDQIRVSAKASDSYFENVIRGRLRELLVTKASLESGTDYETARRTLVDPVQGPKFLKDNQLYTLLYGPPPEKGRARVQMIEDAVQMIEAWKF
jgi:hypothetical protein